MAPRSPRSQDEGEQASAPLDTSEQALDVSSTANGADVAPTPVPPPIWEVEVFDRRLKAGRTKPPLVLARDENEVLRRAVLKPPGDQSPAEFLVEWLSFWVGRALGLDCAVFYGGLRRKKIPFDELESSLEKLTDEWFSELGAVAPAIWFPNGSRQQLATILDVLRKRRDQAATWLKGVQRWLT